MTVKATVTDTDHGWKAFLAPFMSRQTIRVECDVGTSDAPYWYFLEWGTVKMAPRPFVQFTMDEHDNYQAQLQRIAAHALKSPGANIVLTLAANLKTLGEQIVRDLQRTIIGMGLIDTGNLHDSMRVLGVGEVPVNAPSDASARTASVTL